MWRNETDGTTTATPQQVYGLLADVTTWPTWNPGVREIELAGPFAAGAEAVMVFPDGASLPFTVTWAEPGRGYEDLTEVPDANVVVRVRHELEPVSGGTRIVYRADVEGSDPEVCAEVGAQVTEDFGEVIAGLARAAER